MSPGSNQGEPVVHIASLLRSKGSFVATIGVRSSVTEVLAGLAEHGVGALVVSGDDGRIAGIVSERDIVRALHTRGLAVLDESVTQVMTADVQTCAPTDSVDVLMALMSERRIRHVPIVVEGELAGIVSIGDVVKSRIGELESENSAIIGYIQTGR